MESIFEQLDGLHDRIMKRAYEIFDSSGHILGRELDNWLQAEQELIWKPSIELEEKDNKFFLQIAVPGIESKDLDIEVTPEHLLVKAEMYRKSDDEKGKIHKSEFAAGNLFRAVHFPKKIDPDKVKAEFKDGMLRVTAEVAEESEPRKIAVQAS
jgi:HSP20 family protein